MFYKMTQERGEPMNIKNIKYSRSRKNRIFLKVSSLKFNDFTQNT